MINDPAIESLTRFLDLSVYRSGLILSNMANVDTPNYKTRDINFLEELQSVGETNELASLQPAAHAVPGLIERPDGNNVNVERESLLLADTQMRFNTCVELLRDRFKMLSSAIHEGSGS